MDSTKFLNRVFLAWRFHALKSWTLFLNCAAWEPYCFILLAAHERYIIVFCCVIKETGFCAALGNHNCNPSYSPNIYIPEQYKNKTLIFMSITKCIIGKSIDNCLKLIFLEQHKIKKSVLTSNTKLNKRQLINNNKLCIHGQHKILK